MLGGATGGAWLAGCQSNKGITGRTENVVAKEVIYPEKLKYGSTIGLIAPASFASEEKVDRAIKNLSELGLKVIEGNYLREKNGFVAGTDEQRLEDLHNMFEDPGIDGIWCVRGGYGAGRLLDYIDYDLVRKNPKVFIGYSDITSLVNAFFYKSGLICFHGPVASSKFTYYTSLYLNRALFDPGFTFTVLPNRDYDEGGEVYTVLKPGEAEGIMVGGNLSLLASMCGTGFLPDFKDKIVFIEDIGESSYRVDRMIVQLRQATNIDLASALIFGNFTNCKAENGDQTVEEVITNQFKELACPQVMGYSIGHIDNHCTIPVGINANFRSKDGLIRFKA